MARPLIKPKVRRQMIFYRWLVIENNPEAKIYQVLPCKTREEAERTAEDLGQVRGSEHFWVAEAKVDDDWNLFWSGTEMGFPLESGEGVG